MAQESALKPTIRQLRNQGQLTTAVAIETAALIERYEVGIEQMTPGPGRDEMVAQRDRHVAYLRHTLMLGD